jgi:hypothetical protein
VWVSSAVNTDESLSRCGYELCRKERDLNAPSL